jgi:hypothetical protein
VIENKYAGIRSPSVLLGDFLVSHDFGIFICALEHGSWKEGNLTRKAVLCRTSEDEKLCSVVVL